MRVSELLIVTLLTACIASTPAPPPATVVSPPPAQCAGAGCSTGPTEQTSTPAATPPAATLALADGQACIESAQCGSGVCEGQGCGDNAPGVCAPKARACTRDLRAYCGCDGATFQSSGSCPGRRYAAKGACSGTAP